MQITMAKAEFDEAIRLAEIKGALDGFTAFRDQIEEAYNDMNRNFFSRASKSTNIEMCKRIYSMITPIIIKLKSKQ